MENDASKKISVIIPCFNSSETIQRALNSVCNQTIKPQELILIDDASSDNTLEILEDFASKNHDFSVILIENNINLGAGPSRNKGWDLATGEWIAFLDSDDAWLENKLEIQIEFIQIIKVVDVLSFNSVFFTDYQRNSGKSLSKFKKIHFNRVLFRNPIVTRTVAVRRSFPNRFPKGLSEDYGLWLELLACGFNIFKVDIVVALTFRPEYSKGGVSSQLFMHEFFEIKRLCAYLAKSPFYVSLAIPFSLVKFMRRIMIIIIRQIRR